MKTNLDTTIYELKFMHWFCLPDSICGAGQGK